MLSLFFALAAAVSIGTLGGTLGSAQRTTEPRMPERFSVSFYVSDTENDPLDSTG